MGEFRFRVPVEWQLDPYHANSIHIVGIDGIPWPCRISVGEDPVIDSETGKPSGKLLTVSRNRDESGKLFTVYPFSKRGELLICSGTLPSREAPYQLLTELARGTLNRLRNQISIWMEGGLNIPDSVNSAVQKATGFLSRSILSEQPETKDESASQSIELAMDAIFGLSKAFGEQVSKFRRENEQMSTFWFGNQVGSKAQYEPSISEASFDLARICIGPDSETSISGAGGRDPSAIEKRVIVGPWLDASIGGMSNRLINLDDFLARKDQLLIEGRNQLEDLPRATSLIHVVSGLNGIGHRNLSYPQQLQITVDLIRLVEESEVELPTMVSFDFPWAERLVGAVGGVHPLQVADSMLRQGLEVGFLGLDINLDYWPNGSMLRDPLQWIDLIDIWSQLGLPMILNLKIPTGLPPAAETASREINRSLSNLTDANRIDFLETALSVMIARPSVHGVIWPQWQDDDDRRYPGAGLVDSEGNEKPILDLIRRLRQQASS